MVLTGTVVILAILALWLGCAALVAHRLGTTFRQAMFYAPLKLLLRIDDAEIRRARATDAPVIYVVTHQSRLEPALMLSLLPADTLHILDERSARSLWLEPWRELARTIAFNASHVFVSRRLVRHLRGRGRLAVYFPDAVEPDIKAFRLYRAVSRIAVKAEARVVPIHIAGSGDSLFSLAVPPPRRRLFPRLRIHALPPLTVAEIVAHGGARRATNSNAFFDRIVEARYVSQTVPRSVFAAVADAARRFGPARPVMDEGPGGPLTYRALLIRARMLARPLLASDDGAAVGLMLPDGSAFASSFLALQSAGRAAAPLDARATAESVAGAAHLAGIRTVLSSRAYVEQAKLQDRIAALEKQGVRILWLEGLTNRISLADTITAQFGWRRPLKETSPNEAAAILSSAGTEAAPKAVVLSHRNLLANAAQIATRIRIVPGDTLFSALPAGSGFGLIAGLLVPLLGGGRLRREMSPAPDILLAPGGRLAGMAAEAKDGDLAGLRAVLACCEPVPAEVRRAWRERFGVEIMEGYGLAEAGSIVALNSATHRRGGSAGRVLPGVAVRIEPVEGLEESGRLWISGANVMLGRMTADRPGEIEPLSGEWLDTGDIVSIDREGFVTIRGRASRFARIGGEAVSLDAMEKLAAACWPQARHAVVAVPNRRRGERAVLVTTAGKADRNTLRQFAKKAGLGASTVPAEIVAVKEMPMRGNGRVDHAAAGRIASESLGLDHAA